MKLDKERDCFALDRPPRKRARAAGEGTARRAVEGALIRMRTFAPSAMLRMVPLSRFTGEDEIVRPPPSCAWFTSAVSPGGEIQ